ncbi:hypothetical protein [Winogradskyella sp. A2]|uniref:hypothetical protein n=1 Tax=Winogradskyella sp. A2 TaxID=3366944 RepID=UPI00398C5447
MLNNIKLTSKDSLSRYLHSVNIYTWDDLITHVKNLPYGRNSNRYDFDLVIKENKGTCSSKHALLKKVAELNELSSVKLILGIYKMNPTNTPKIGKVLSKNSIDYIPEAHCYLLIDGVRFDFTNSNSKFESIENDIINEIKISPEEVVEFKVIYHKTFIKDWLQQSKSKYTFEHIWEIREKCIEVLNLN